MPSGRTKKAQKQHGGMKLSHAAVKYLIDRGKDYNELTLIRLLIANTNSIRVVYDASTYSFVFELTTPGKILIDPFGEDLAASAATRAAHAAIAAGAPEPGTPVSTFCAKISFVHDGDSLKKKYDVSLLKTVTKKTVTRIKANKEAATQCMLFEEFACLRTTAPFVPDVIAHAILAGADFQAIFGGILSSTSDSRRIYAWINEWIASDGIMIDVNLMEMLDFQRTAPSVPRTEQFTMIHRLSLRSDLQNYTRAALRMMAEIAAVRGKGIMPHDFHEGNGMATKDGLQLYLIDWGGIFDLKVPADLQHLLKMFNDMCYDSYDTCAAANAGATKEIQAMPKSATAVDIERMTRIARFPSLSELCGFFEIKFRAAQMIPIISELNTAFGQRLTAYVDFTCETPTPQNVHSALMMVAFVDFMVNRMDFNYPYCQCGSVLKVVYPDKVVAPTPSTTHGLSVTAFDDFRLFLDAFEVGNFSSHTRLLEVVAIINETVQICPSACGLPLQAQDLRVDRWINDEIKRREKEEAAARRLEARRLAEEAEARRLAEEAEARRLAEEAEARRLAEAAEARAKKAARRPETEERAKKASMTGEAEARILQDAEREARARNAAVAKAKEKTSRDRLFALSTASGIAKPPTKSAKSEVAEIKSAIQAIESQDPVAVPRSLLSRLSSGLSSGFSSVSSKFRNLSFPWKKRGGTRKQCKQHKQRKSFTQRRHN